MTDDHPNRAGLDELFRGDAFAGTLGAQLVDWGGGWAEFALTPTSDHTNFSGSVHGGVVFSLGDLAFSVACNAWGRVAVALTVDIQFLTAVTPDAPLVATARERSRSRRTGAYLVEVHAGQALAASLHAMAFRTSAWHLGEPAWDEAWRAAH